MNIRSHVTAVMTATLLMCPSFAASEAAPAGLSVRVGDAASLATAALAASAERGVEHAGVPCYAVALVAPQKPQAPRRPRPTSKRKSPSSKQKSPAPAFRRFDHTTSAYTPVNSYLSMVAVEQNYWDAHRAETEAQFERRARKWFLGNGFDEVVFVKDNRVGTQSVLLSNKDMALVVVRGSELTRGTRKSKITGKKTKDYAVEEMMKDWVGADMNVRQVVGGSRFGGTRAKVHQGFKSAGAGVADELQERLKSRDVGAGPGSKKPIFIAGHSLGAAVATLLTFNLKQAGFPVQALYAHASPMVSAGPLFGVMLNNTGVKVYRTVNYKDPVPDYPESLLRVGRQLRVAGAVGAILPYSHVPSTLYYLDKRGRVRKSPSKDFLKRDRGVINLRFGDHSGRFYINRLYSAIPARDRAGLPLF